MLETPLDLVEFGVVLALDAGGNDGLGAGLPLSRSSLLCETSERTRFSGNFG
jgi:hypothetical protein